MKLLQASVRQLHPRKWAVRRTASTFSVLSLRGTRALVTKDADLQRQGLPAGVDHSDATSTRSTAGLSRRSSSSGALGAAAWAHSISLR